MTKNRRLFLLIGLAILPGLPMVLLVGGLAVYLAFFQDEPVALEARDPNSPTVIRVEPIPLTNMRWSVIISVDGQRPTQQAGWPSDMITPPTGLIPSAVYPTSLLWHTAPNWVEIVLSTGQRLKLTWNQDAVEKARSSNEQVFFLDPRYEVIKEP